MAAAGKILTAVAVALSISSPAYADTTIGDRLQDIIQSSFGPLIFVVTIGSFVGGLFLLAKGLLRMRDVSTGHDRDGVGTALATILAAAMLLALPEAAGVGMSSLMGSGQNSMVSQSDLQSAQADLDATQNSSSLSSAYAMMAGVQSPTNCFSTSSTVTCIANNLAMNVVPVGIICIFVFVFAAGLWMFASSMMALSKLEGRGLPEGWWTKLASAILLMNGPVLFMAVSQTLLGNDELISTSGVNTSSSMLSYSIGASSKLKPYEDLIGYLFVILVLFGVIAFVRGILIIRAAGQGGGNATYGHGLTFMFAGILLANAKYTTCTILTTAGIQELSSFGFCN